MSDLNRPCPRCGESVEDPQASFCPACGASVPVPVAIPAPAPEPMAQIPAPGRASCPVHPGQPAADLCSRCGAFMCATCREGDSALCPGCRGRVEPMQIPFTRDAWTFGGLVEFAWERFKADWVLLSVGLLIVAGIGWGVSMAGQGVQLAATAVGGEVAALFVTGVVFLVQTVLQGVVQLGFFRVVADSLVGRKVELGGLFTQFGKLGKLVGTTLLTWLLLGGPIALIAGGLYGVFQFASESTAFVVIGFATLVLFVPFIYWSMGFTFVQFELAFCDDVGPVDAVKRSFALVDGQRVGVFGTLFVAGLIGGLGILACCVGVLATGALAQAITVGLYLALRSGSGLPPASYPR